MTSPGQGFWSRLRTTVLSWVDSSAGAKAMEAAAGDPAQQRIDWLRALPFFGMHVSCVAVVWVGWSPVAVWVAVGLYAVRMFAITAFYHRFFSHRSFQTSRVVQFLFAVVGASSVQRGPLWWAAHHRDHHRFTEQPKDVHSPHRHGFWWSHMGWFLSPANFRLRAENVPDFARFRELRLLDRFDLAVPLLLMGTLYGVGELLAATAPGLGTNGWQMLVWGFLVSTVVLYHITFSINSVAHLLGWRRFDTPDESRNNWLLALLTFGEGWHNNHHRNPAAVRQGLTPWEVDLTYGVLKVFERLGLVWGLVPAPRRDGDAVAGRGA